MAVYLCTGGAGYIGSHACVELLGAGHDVVVLDDLSRGSTRAIEHVGRIVGRTPSLYVGDLADAVLVDRVFTEHPIDGVIHFAGFKSVNESIGAPLTYYANNLCSTLTLLGAMEAHGVHRLVFSSSATVYGPPGGNPIGEEAAINPTNPYGRTKAMIESMLSDLAAADPAWRIAVLRYFNPVGAHPSGLIGEDPRGVPNNLFPFIMRVAGGSLAELPVHGSDYPTRDGTAIRDFVHVVDLVKGHLVALEQLDSLGGYEVFNLGTGRGTTVLEALEAARRVTGRPIPHRLEPRRPGDVGEAWARVERATERLGWKAELTVADALADQWRWESQFPAGYATPAADPTPAG